jgi:hypothetical protein
MKQETAYPWDGSVKITVNPEKSKTFTLAIRIPGWARNQPVPSDLYRYMDPDDQKAVIHVNGEPHDYILERGFARINRRWVEGDTVDINLPLSVRRVLSQKNVEENAGKVALERGPIVYCAEWVDNNGFVSNLVLDDTAQLWPEKQEELLNGVVVINGEVTALTYAEDGETEIKVEQAFTAIPYYAWSHRGKGEMTVWIPRNESNARILPHPTIASTSTVSVSGGKSGMALNDQWEPTDSNDHSKPYLHWWPNKGTKEWVQYDFPEPTIVSSVDVYWFDDTGQGECRIPKSRQVLYKTVSSWEPVNNIDFYRVEKDSYNSVSFKPVQTTALRLEIQLQDKFSAGIIEWKVE